MPTKKPRVAVTLNPETDQVIERWARLQKRTKGKVISELLDGVIEPLARAADLMEAAANAPDDVKQGMLEAMLSLESDVLGAYSTVIGAYEVIDRATGKSGNPRACNTGVRFVRDPKTKGDDS